MVSKDYWGMMTADTLKKPPNEVEVALALTALDKRWHMAKPPVFLGPWCRKPAEDFAANTEDPVVLLKQGSDRAELYDTVAYAKKVYEQTLPDVAHCLGEIHGIDRSIRYWRILIGRVLWHQITVLFDRYVGLKKALARYPNLRAVGLSPSSYHTALTGEDLHQATEFNDALNLQFFSQVADLLDLSMKRRDYEWSIPSKRDLEPGPLRRFLLRPLKRGALHVFDFERGSYSPVALHGMEIPRRRLYQITLATQFEAWLTGKLNEEGLRHSVGRDAAKRKAFKELQGPDEFSTFVLHTLATNMPFAYVELFEKIKSEVEQAVEQGGYPEVIVSGHLAGPHRQIWQAESMEHGATLVGMQHGGWYGEVAFYYDEEHEKAISDQYVTWGWREDETDVPLPAMKLMDMPPATVTQEQRQVLWLARSCRVYLESRYTNDISSLLNDERPLPYVNKQERFYQQVAAPIRSHVLLRLKPNRYPDLKGFDQKLRSWLDRRFAGLCIDDHRASMRERIREARLVVIDHFASTSFLEALVINKPVILFSDTGQFDIRGPARSYYEELRRVNVFHDTPESAATTVNEIYEDVEAWWRAPERQAAVKKFTRRFACTSPKAVDEWSRFLKQVLSETREQA